MVRGGRKGQHEMSLDVIISIMFIGVFAIAIIYYTATSVDATGYQAKFHAHNLQTAAEAAAASNGDVLIRYDNFRDDTEVGFRFGPGIITGGKVIEGGEEASDVTDLGEVSVVNPTERRYGMPLRYPKEVAIAQPQSLILRKLGDQFTITETIERLESCPTVKRPKINLQNSKLRLTTDGSFSSAERNQLLQTFRQTGRVEISEAESSEEATLTIILSQKKGSNQIEAKPTDNDGREILCNFHDQISILDPFNEYTLSMPSSTNQEKTRIEITILTNSETPLDEGQIGTALKSAVVRYFE